MDVFAHGLWGGAAYTAIKRNTQKPIAMKWAVFFSVFPDLFAFVPVFIWMFFSVIFGTLAFSDLPHPDAVEPARRDTLLIFRFTAQLYQFSHSIIIFFIIFALAHAILRRPVWELGAWLFHILIDIPTHSYQFYPTPFLWPLSGVMVDGISWGTPWFMIANYSILAGVYAVLCIQKRRRKKTP